MSFAFILGISNLEITLSAREQEKVKISTIYEFYISESSNGLRFFLQSEKIGKEDKYFLKQNLILF